MLRDADEPVRLRGSPPRKEDLPMPLLPLLSLQLHQSNSSSIGLPKHNTTIGISPWRRHWSRQAAPTDLKGCQMVSQTRLQVKNASTLRRIGASAVKIRVSLPFILTKEVCSGAVAFLCGKHPYKNNPPAISTVQVDNIAQAWAGGLPQKWPTTKLQSTYKPQKHCCYIIPEFDDLKRPGAISSWVRSHPTTNPQFCPLNLAGRFSVAVFDEAHTWVLI
ncbi:predicted protein [Histoplasma capsulatum G186AR]|uniref:Uncharacterized protein n=1 Tax=Ajellomyces capsulatus (strain G186AR / H82 / ATCC MYA-2454 / RMSCC 2432) TaxID=447093 RepID=C0NQ50_AJECG|nr:uncharacterized protein HCBG_05280 [Histoplasma capsulatum G186AR]EEH07060.1 predicted protein [Histoplasma capsulatum G186AR]